MKPDPDYLRRLLNALQASTNPWPSITELASSGIIPDESLLFHLQLLDDGGFVQPVHAGHNYGFVVMGNELSWQSATLRLTAQGHEFIEALDKREVWDIIKSQFQDASLKTLYQVGRALVEGYAREIIRKNVGDIKF